jgi:hypothetical protein
MAVAASGLLEAGLRFLETLAAPAAMAVGGSSVSPIERFLASAVQTDPRTGQPVLSIPMPATITRERLAGALAGLLGALGGGR